MLLLSTYSLFIRPTHRNAVDWMEWIHFSLYCQTETHTFYAIIKWPETDQSSVKIRGLIRCVRYISVRIQFFIYSKCVMCDT